MALPELRMDVHGNLPSGFLEHVLNIVIECYCRLADLPLPTLVELRLVDTVARWRKLLFEERTMLGILTGGNTEWPATHDAWLGYSRITVCAERCAAQPPLIADAALRVVVGHTVLHGTVDHYVFHISSEALEQAQTQGIDREVLEHLLYHVATAVKGYEVARLLARHGYWADQVALAFQQLVLSPEDRLAWQLAQRDRRARLIYLTAQLKPLLFAQPFLARAPVLAHAIQEMTALLPTTESKRIHQLAAEIALALHQEGAGTTENIKKAFGLAWERLV